MLQARLFRETGVGSGSAKRSILLRAGGSCVLRSHKYRLPQFTPVILWRHVRILIWTIRHTTLLDDPMACWESVYTYHKHFKGQVKGKSFVWCSIKWFYSVYFWVPNEFLVATVVTYLIVLNTNCSTLNYLLVLLFPYRLAPYPFWLHGLSSPLPVRIFPPSSLPITAKWIVYTWRQLAGTNILIIQHVTRSVYWHFILPETFLNYPTSKQIAW